MTWDKNAHRGKGIHLSLQHFTIPAQCSHPYPRQLLLRTLGGGVGVATQPPPLRVTQALGTLWAVWLPQLAGPQRVEQELLPGHPFLGEAKDSLMGSRPPSSISWSDALLICLPTHTGPILPAWDTEPQRPSNLKCPLPPSHLRSSLENTAFGT